MNPHEKSSPSEEGPTIEKKIIKHFGTPIGESERHYDKSGRVVFEKATNFLTGAINVAEYLYDQNGDLKEEIWRDRNGKVARYAHSKEDGRSLIKADSGFEDADV